ncbi:MAG: hypothetical protein AAF409_05005 [Pseudomonadota bacterium]
MHSEDGEEDLRISNYYGKAPSFVGLLLAAAIVVLMFVLADGFS